MDTLTVKPATSPVSADALPGEEDRPAHDEAVAPDAPVQPGALESLEQLIREKMPITEHLGFSLSWTASGLVASAPLEPNRNHAESAFGGSLSMLATLTGWATMYLVMQDIKEAAQVVIQRGCIEYLQPVRDDFSVLCPWPDEDTLERFRDTLSRWGRARLSLGCTVGEDCDQSVAYTAQYVALKEGDEA